MASPSPQASLPGHSFIIEHVDGFRWFNAGTYSYRVQYVYKNGSSSTATYTLRDVAVFGPGGDMLPGYSSVDLHRATVIGPGSDTTAASTTISGDSRSVAHLYGERVRVVVQIDEGNRRAMLTAEHTVAHPPQTARLIEFSTSPVMGVESGDAPEVKLGQPVTVHWNVVDGGSRVVLETSIGRPPGGRAPGEVVEAAGSRTFTAARTGVQSLTLYVDSFIRKTLSLHVVQ